MSDRYDKMAEAIVWETTAHATAHKDYGQTTSDLAEKLRRIDAEATATATKWQGWTILAALEASEAKAARMREALSDVMDKCAHYVLDDPQKAFGECRDQEYGQHNLASAILKQISAALREGGAE